MPKSSLKVAEFSARDPVFSMARAMSFAPDGSLLTVARHIEQKGPTFFVRWDTAKGQVLQSEKRAERGWGQSPTTLRLAPEESVFVTDQFSGTGTMRTLFEFRDARTLAVKKKLQCSNPNIFLSLDWSPDGRQFIASAMDGLTRIWDGTKQAKELDNGYVFVGFNAAGQLFGADSGVYSMNPKTGVGRRQVKIPGPASSPPNHVLSQDRAWLISAPSRRGGKITITDTATWKTRSISIGKQSDSRILAVSPDNRLVACGYANGRVLAWNLVTGKKVADFTTSRKCLKCLAFSRDSQWLAGCNFYNIFVVKLRDG